MKEFLELQRVELLARHWQGQANCRVTTLTDVKLQRFSYPVLGFTMGSEDPTAPTYGLFGGVHGLEKIGTHLVLYFLESLLKQLEWDKELQERFKHMRLVAIPLVNPGGMKMGRRSNPNGVDLMRNAPVDAEKSPAFLVGGHRLGPWLPWYRGPKGTIEQESKAVFDFVTEHCLQSHACLSIDIHSGFGMVDRLWFPYAKTKSPFPKLAQVQQIEKLLDSAQPYHIYQVEPQSLSYTTHGDLWDYLFDLYQEKHQGTNHTFIPWTLELGSWLWVRKNPRQLLSILGAFNPLRTHRYQRIMRRHQPMLDLFARIVINPQSWGAGS